MSSVLKSVFQPKMLVVLLMGFSSGLPLLLVGGTLKAWLRSADVDLSTIGFFSLVGLPYTLKFVWSPLMDRFVPKAMGRRRGWLLATQLILMLGFTAMAFQNPKVSISLMAGLAVLIAFISSSQDIVVDAYRREILKDEELGFGSALAINGYRVAIWASTAFALIIADAFSWKAAYLAMAGFMLVGLLTTVFAPEPRVDAPPPRTLKEAVVEPFKDFFGREGVRKALMVLSFILLYKIGDSMASDMLNPFYIDMGFTLTEIGAIAKTLGLVGTLGGALFGGLVILKIGIVRSLWIFGLLQAVSTGAFFMLAQIGHSVPMLMFVIGFETLTGGMGTAAYAGFMASLTNKRFTATQYALLTSLMGVPRVIFGATTGVLADALGWQGFFLFCTLIAVPGMVLLHFVAPWGGGKKPGTSAGVAEAPQTA